jgi:hypothetical protein
MVGSCDHGNKPSGSIKVGNFLTNLVSIVSQEGHCSMELVS